MSGRVTDYANVIQALSAVPATSRRDFLRSSSMGFGWLAFAGSGESVIGGILR